jgi:hypothetical protein
MFLRCLVFDFYLGLMIALVANHVTKLRPLQKKIVRKNQFMVKRAQLVVNEHQIYVNT